MGAVIFATIVFLTLMGTAQAFDEAEIQFCEYRITGPATQSMVTSAATGQSIQYMGKSYLEGFIVELNGTFKGHGEMSLDYGTMLQFPDLITNYYCEFTVEQYDWDSEKNKLIDRAASIACYELGKYNPLLFQGSQ